MKKLFIIYVDRDVKNNIVELGVRILRVEIGLDLVLRVGKRLCVCGVCPIVRLVERKEAYK